MFPSNLIFKQKFPKWRELLLLLIFVLFPLTLSWWHYLTLLQIYLRSRSECWSSDFTSLYPLIQPLLVRVQYFTYFACDVLLPVVLLGNYFLQRFRAVLLSHVGHSHLQLSPFLFQLKLNNLLCFILLSGGRLLFLLLRFFFCGYLIWLSLFFHRVLL